MQPGRPPVDLDWYVDQMTEHLPGWGIPRWDGFLLTEEPVWDSHTRRIAKLDRQYSVEDYRSRFHELVTRGWPWINIHALGLLRGHMVLSIELPAYAPTGVPYTSVNLSGPSNWARAHGCILDGIIDSQTDGSG